MNMKMMICIINLYLIPFISVYWDYRRGKKNYTFNFETFLLYVSYMATLMPIVYIMGVILVKVGFVSYAIDAKTVLYTLIAEVVAFILPYIKEIITVYFKVRCEIKKRNVDKED